MHEHHVTAASPSDDVIMSKPGSADCGLARLWVRRARPRRCRGCAPAPRTRPQALALAWEYFVYNDGYYDYYGADDITQLAAGLLGADTWIAWWD